MRNLALHVYMSGAYTPLDNLMNPWWLWIASHVPATESSPGGDIRSQAIAHATQVETRCLTKSARGRLAAYGAKNASTAKRKPKGSTCALACRRSAAHPSSMPTARCGTDMLLL